MKYKETQFGWFVIILLLIVLALLSLCYFNQWGTNPINLIGYLVLLTLFFVSFLLFFKMTTILSDEHIHISYGIGLISKKINMNQLKAVRIVRNKWYYGLGIRILKDGIMYNIHGLNAVELELKKQTKTIRIGTQDSHKLKFEIDKVIN